MSMSNINNSDANSNPGAVFYVDHLEQGDSVEDQLQFPKVFADCLCTLNLSHNKLQALPNDVCEMKALQVLDIQG